MTTLTLTTLILGLVIVVMFVRDAVVRASKKRDREIVRRFHRYMDKVPPRNPW